MAELRGNQDGGGQIGKSSPQPRSGSSGRITETIGTGENAKNSIVWMTITWSFFIASAMSLLFFSLVVCYKDFSYIESIKSVWSIFVPIITLALGYAFGKSK
jgi:hypothetical protein